MRKKQNIFRKRQTIGLSILALIAISVVFSMPDFWKIPKNNNSSNQNINQSLDVLSSLEVKGRAPKTGYSRDQYGKGWAKDSSGCDTRNRILKRDLTNIVENSDCKIISGTLNDPYTGKTIDFSRKQNASAIQIDHVVALSDAWQKGAQYKTTEERFKIATDPLNLIAVQAAANQQKSDGDAATWLPKNKSFRCQYVARQISVKFKYELWVTEAEKNAMSQILAGCPEQRTY